MTLGFTCVVCGAGGQPGNPLLACFGLCCNFVHNGCLKGTEEVGLCPDCCVIDKKDRKAPNSKHIFVRMLQLTNLTLSLADRISAQDAEILSLRRALESSTRLAPPAVPIENRVLKAKMKHQSALPPNAGNPTHSGSSAVSTSATAAAVHSSSIPSPPICSNTDGDGSKHQQARSLLSAQRTHSASAGDKRRGKKRPTPIIGTGGAIPGFSASPKLSRVFVLRIHCCRQNS